MLNEATDELRIPNPFSAVPTAYRVHARGRWWYGNCAWDALGICAALDADGPSRRPARTAASRRRSIYRASGSATNRFSSTASSRLRIDGTIARWLGGRPPGATISAAKHSELAHAWRDDRISLSPDRKPHTREQNQAILERLGLTGEFWQLARGRHPAGPLQSAEHEPL